MSNYYAYADSILDQCDAGDHPHKMSEVKGKGKTWRVCTDCWNKHVAARRAARKQELADFRAAQKAERDAALADPSRWVKDGGRRVAIEERPGGFAICLGGSTYIASGGWLFGGISTWETYDAAAAYATSKGAIITERTVTQ